MLNAKPENNNKQRKTKESKKRTIVIVGIVIGAIALLSLAIILFFSLRKEADISTAKIMAKLSEKISSITDIVDYSEANDPNGLLGQENQYASKSSWEDNRISNHKSEHAGTIEVFKNTKDAELREWKISNANEACELRITKEKYGSAVKEGWACEEYNMYRKNTVVIRLSPAFSDEQAAEYKKYLNEIIDGFVVPEENVPASERINEVREKEKESIEKNANQSEKNLQEELDKILQQYIDKLDAIAENLNKEELSAARQELDYFKEASYYSSKIASLEQKINDIESKIAEQKQQAEAAAAKAEAEKLASKNRRLGAGKYTVCTDVDSGTYDVVAVSGGGNFFVESDSFSHYVNEILYADGSYGMNKEYKNMSVSCGDIIDIRSTLVVQLTAKR